MVLDERKNRGAVGGEIRYHVGLADEDLSVQDVIVCIVAVVDDERGVHHQACSVALAVGAGVRLVGWQSVVDEKLVVAVSVDDESAAGTFQRRYEVCPAADEP